MQKEENLVMCRAMLENGVFDPALCPLLQGLEPEEIARRLESDPDIIACRAAIEARSGRAGDDRCDGAQPSGRQV